MTKERSRMVYDYVKGNYIENVSDLENDYLFMIDAII